MHCGAGGTGCGGGGQGRARSWPGQSGVHAATRRQATSSMRKIMDALWRWLARAGGRRSGAGRGQRAGLHALCRERAAAAASPAFDDSGNGVLGPARRQPRFCRLPATGAPAVRRARRRRRGLEVRRRSLAAQPLQRGRRAAAAGRRCALYPPSPPDIGTAARRRTAAARTDRFPVFDEGAGRFTVRAGFRAHLAAPARPRLAAFVDDLHVGGRLDGCGEAGGAPAGRPA